MSRIAFGVSVVTVALSGGVAAAQSPAVGQLPPVGDLYGYSPLVPTIDPFPSRTSGYYPSMFNPRYGGKRIYPALPPVVIHPAPVPVPAQVPVVTVLPTQPTVPAGPVVMPAPPRGWHRFRR
jgi:hypothetical protein